MKIVLDFAQSYINAKLNSSATRRELRNQGPIKHFLFHWKCQQPTLPFSSTHKSYFYWVLKAGIIYETSYTDPSSRAEFKAKWCCHLHKHMHHMTLCDQCQSGWKEPKKLAIFNAFGTRERWNQARFFRLLDTPFVVVVKIPLQLWRANLERTKNDERSPLSA